MTHRAMRTFASVLLLVLVDGGDLWIRQTSAVTIVDCALLFFALFFAIALGQNFEETKRTEVMT